MSRRSILENNHLKIVVVGDRAADKTALISRYSGQTGSIDISFEVQFKDIEFCGSSYRVQLWDTTGNERLLSLGMMRPFYRGAHAFILTYSIIDRNSFEKLNTMMDDIKIFCSEGAAIVLVGTHAESEAERQVYRENAQAFADYIDAAGFYECSATTSANVDKAFTHAVEVAIGVHSADAVDEFVMLDLTDIAESAPVPAAEPEAPLSSLHESGAHDRAAARIHNNRSSLFGRVKRFFNKNSDADAAARREARQEAEGRFEL